LDNPATLGKALALLAPVSWSFAIIMFRVTGLKIPPLALNLFKSVLALALFTLTILVLGRDFSGGATTRQINMLLVSGVIGIAVADTLFFMCLNRVGAGMQAIVNTSYSPIIITLSVVFLGERLGMIQALGAGLIVSAVLVVGWVRKGSAAANRVPHRTAGILFGLGGDLTQGVAIVMIKPFLHEVPLIEATWWRLLGGLVISALMIWLIPGQAATLKTLRDRSAWPAMIGASFVGTYLSLLFWMGGMKYADASIAAALNQTATLWTFVLAVLILKEPTTPRRLAGLGLGLIGVLMVSLG
jgi:drug/metabolite transporter (DMT)-like permease